MTKQLAALAVGLALWSVSATPTFAALVIAFLALRVLVTA